MACVRCPVRRKACACDTRRRPSRGRCGRGRHCNLARRSPRWEAPYPRPRACRCLKLGPASAFRLGRRAWSGSRRYPGRRPRGAWQPAAARARSPSSVAPAVAEGEEEEKRKKEQEEARRKEEERKILEEARLKVEAEVAEKARVEEEERRVYQASFKGRLEAMVACCRPPDVDTKDRDADEEPVKVS
mmetsp:Transcript_14159/g.38908  ORF Transcript_14159/g.38908 Transcript_14159/m.38908 type:complete len:188 (+) Transcript_14159:252-815(+)